MKVIINKKLIILIGDINSNSLGNIVEENIGNSKTYLNPERQYSIKIQIEIARDIVSEIKQGNKVMLITESWYILQELNAFITLFNLKNNKELLSKYNIKEECLINPNDAIGYEFYDNKLQELEITTKEGVISKYVDEIINCINTRADDIYYSE